MRIRTTLPGLIAAILCSATLAAAQPWYVQSADWGAGNRTQDVTRTVRSLVSGGNFKANPKTLGVDPAPGQGKALRIIGRDQSGAVRTFTYNEGETVNVSRFTSGNNWGGGGGGWGNSGLRILQAEWRATNDRRGVINVTSRLQSMVRNDRLSVTVNNKTLGGDPAPGKTKELYVSYRYRGRDNSTTVREGRTLTIP